MNAASSLFDQNDLTAQSPAETPLNPATSPELATDKALAPITQTAEEDAITREEMREDDAVVERVGHLKHDVGWVLVTAGIVGLILPGVLGTPFLIMGAFALWPGNRKRMEHWRQGHSPKFFHGGMKQINRFLDDLERRYPRIGKR